MQDGVSSLEELEPHLRHFLVVTLQASITKGIKETRQSEKAENSPSPLPHPLSPQNLAHKLLHLTLLLGPFTLARQTLQAVVNDLARRLVVRLRHVVRAVHALGGGPLAATRCRDGLRVGASEEEARLFAHAGQMLASLLFEIEDSKEVEGGLGLSWFGWFGDGCSWGLVRNVVCSRKTHYSTREVSVDTAEEKRFEHSGVASGCYIGDPSMQASFVLVSFANEDSGTVVC